MPAERETDARAFYSGLLGIPEVPKPSGLTDRGGVWFENDSVKIHLGVDPEFRPARKAHPCLIVDDLAGFVQTLQSAGYPMVESYVNDPFGNRLELKQSL